MKYERKELYGGAITVQLPSGLVDASLFRQIPDTQEVFLSTVESLINKDDAVIIDLLERVDGVESDLSALEYHLSEISKLNGVDQESTKVLFKEKVETTNFKQDYSGIVIAGEEAKKWGRDRVTLVLVLGLIRLKKAETDLLVSYNMPFTEEQELDDLKKALNGDNSSFNSALSRISVGKEIVLKVFETIKVEDWNLFG